MDNLRLAFNAISERYPDNANPEAFNDYVNATVKDSGGTFTAAEVLQKINFTRRHHHYNYLSMNEIFTMPPLKIDSQGERGLLRRLGYAFIWVPFGVQLLIIANDALTVYKGWQVSHLLTGFSLMIATCMAGAILKATQTCLRKKRTVYTLYEKYKAASFRYDDAMKLMADPPANTDMVATDKKPTEVV